jgi:hypothetical protein
MRHIATVFITMSLLFSGLSLPTPGTIGLATVQAAPKHVHKIRKVRRITATARARHQSWCAKHPVQCKKRRLKKQAWCKKHPIKCAETKRQDLDLED